MWIVKNPFHKWFGKKVWVLSRVFGSNLLTVIPAGGGEIENIFLKELEWKE